MEKRKEFRQTNPAKCTFPSISRLTGFLRIASIIKNNSRPPSTAGIGNKFNTPDLEIKRNGEKLTKTIIPKQNETGRYLLGFSPLVKAGMFSSDELEGKSYPKANLWDTISSMANTKFIKGPAKTTAILTHTLLSEKLLSAISPVLSSPIINNECIYCEKELYFRRFTCCG